MLENPADFGIETSSLVLSVAVKSKTSDILKIEDFDFHIMDEADSLYGTKSVPAPHVETDLDDDEPAYRPDWLIVTDFKHEFLFQDLRVSFHYKPYQKHCIIALNH